MFCASLRWEKLIPLASISWTKVFGGKHMTTAEWNQAHCFSAPQMDLIWNGVRGLALSGKWRGKLFLNPTCVGFKNSQTQRPNLRSVSPSSSSNNRLNSHRRSSCLEWGEDKQAGIKLDFPEPTLSKAFLGIIKKVLDEWEQMWNCVTDKCTIVGLWESWLCLPVSGSKLYYILFFNISEPDLFSFTHYL